MIKTPLQNLSIQHICGHKEYFIESSNARILKNFYASASLFPKGFICICTGFWSAFLSSFYGSSDKSDKVSILLIGETLLETLLINSEALESSRGERAKRFWIRTLVF